MQTIDNVRMKYFIVRRNMTQNFKKKSTSFFNSGFNYFFQLIFTFLETNKKKKMMSLIAAKSNVDQKCLLGEEVPTGLNTNYM